MSSGIGDRNRCGFRAQVQRGMLKNVPSQQNDVHILADVHDSSCFDCADGEDGPEQYPLLRLSTDPVNGRARQRECCEVQHVGCLCRNYCPVASCVQISSLSLGPQFLWIRDLNRTPWERRLKVEVEACRLFSQLFALLRPCSRSTAPRPARKSISKESLDRPQQQLTCDREPRPTCLSSLSTAIREWRDSAFHPPQTLLTSSYSSAIPSLLDRFVAQRSIRYIGQEPWFQASCTSRNSLL